MRLMRMTDVISSSSDDTHTHTHIYIYIYIGTCINTSSHGDVTSCQLTRRPRETGTNLIWLEE